MLITDGSGGLSDETTAPFTFLLSNPTLYAFSPELVEEAQRNTYQADDSKVVYSIVVSGNLLDFIRATGSDVLATVAGQWANAWNINRAVPGVADIAETQDASPLGSLYDVVQVAVVSTSGKSTSILTLTDNQLPPDAFAPIIRAEVQRLDAAEVA